ncbi:MAG TPA: molybdopterin dinucleotide binding domain-containing protein, partial [Gemmatimonadales bacterium]|nr:molybdopterin dinucleotide binding domain-containing protein [Gemmatimonadales bacterium]
ISDRQAPGQVFIPFHFREAAANLLTNPALDPYAKIAEFKVSAVSVMPA